MIPYYIMVGIPAFLSICLKRVYIDSNKLNRIVIDSFFVLWFFLLVLRSLELGSDVVLYKFHFQSYSSYSWKYIFTGIVNGYFEAGFVVISKLVSYFTNSFRVALTVVTLISVAPIWWLYRKEGKFGFLLIVLFLNIAPFSMYFSGLRQVMAMAFVAPCLSACKEKNLMKFVLYVLLAYLFHTSAIVMMLIYPVYHVKLDKQFYLLFFIPLFFVIFTNKAPIFKFLISFLDKYSERYEESIGETGAYSVFILLLALLVYSFVIVDQKKLDRETIGFRNILVLCVVFQIFAGIHHIAMRVNYYFLTIVPLLIPRVIAASNKQMEQIVKLSVVVYYAFFTVYYFYHAIYGGDSLNIYPYISILRDL